MSVSIIQGDCIDVMSMMPADSVQTCVTSPPYFGLRDYGVAGQIGLEDTVQDYLDTMVSVFVEVRRILRDDGTLWINLGDSYAGSWGAQGHRLTDGGISGEQIRNHPKRASLTGKLRAAGVKAKDLYGMPWRLAFALQADGWYLRQDIIWHKPNPMPESTRDRCTRAHEYIFMFTKKPRYYYDADAIKTDSKWNPAKSKKPDGWDTGPGAHGSFHRDGREKGARTDKQSGHGPRHAGFNDRYFSQDSVSVKANKRSVWTVTTKPFKEAHFATFPPDLIEPCILAGSPTGGMVLDPFGGAGTTGLVAQRLGRNATLIELNPEYITIAEKRLAADRTMENLL